MRRSPNEYEDIVKVIIDIFLDYDIKEFPVNEKDICRKLGVALVPYSAYSEEDRALFTKKSKCGFYVKRSMENPPTIFYNDLLDSRGTIRFNIFHEVKHYVFNEDLNDYENDDLADFFSRFFMCPIPFLIMKGIEDINGIISFCDVNEVIANHVISNIHNRKNRYGYQIFAHEKCLLKHLDIETYEVYKRSHVGGDDNWNIYFLKGKALFDYAIAVA